MGQNSCFCHTKLITSSRSTTLWTVLCTDLLSTYFGNNGRNILFQKFSSEMRICKICKSIDTGLSPYHLFTFTTRLITLFAYGLLSFINHSVTILVILQATHTHTHTHTHTYIYIKQLAGTCECSDELSDSIKLQRIS